MSYGAEQINVGKRRRGRPPGRKYTKPLAVRVPPEVEKAIRACTRLLGVSLSELLRAGIQNRLFVAAVAADKLLDEEPDMPEYRRERIERFLNAANKAAASLYGPPWMLQVIEEIEHHGRRLFWGLGRTRTTSRPDRKFAKAVERLDPQMSTSGSNEHGDEPPGPSAVKQPA